MVSIIEGVKSLFFKRENKLNYLYLFAIAAILSGISSYFEIHENTGILSTILSTVIYSVLTIYIGGYFLMFINNVYFHKDELLPKFNTEPFKVFVKAIPLYFIWFIYTLIFMISLFIPYAGWVFFILLLPFISLVYVAYAKDYNSKGLYNINLPFIYMKKSFVETWLTFLKFLGFCLLVILPVIFLTLLVGIFYNVNQNEMTYFIGILGGYISLILTFVWEYCLVKIYQNKIEEQPESCPV